MDFHIPVYLTAKKNFQFRCCRVPALCNILLKYNDMQQSAGTLLHIKLIQFKIIDYDTIFL